MRADRAAWIRILEKVSTLKKGGDVESDPAVTYHLLPCPGKNIPNPGDKIKGDKPPKRKVHEDERAERKKGKGKGGKGAPQKNCRPQPQHLQGRSHMLEL